MDVWETIRMRCRRDGEEIKPVARDLGLAPNTVRKYLRQIDPPSRKPRPRTSSLERYRSHIDGLILSTPKITAARIGSYLRQNIDADLVADERTLRHYVATRRTVLVPREAFVRAAYAPGDQSQFDFSPMSVRLAGVIVVLQLFVLRLSYSGRFTARVSFRCDRPALFAGLLAGFTRFGGLTRTALFDNATTAVKRILRGRDREENDAFAAFRGGLALNVEYAAPAKGNEKGGVEGVHGYIEDSFFRPMPDYDHIDRINAELDAFCDRSLNRTIAPNKETIGERFAHEQLSLLPLPPVMPRACVTRYVKINKYSEISFERNWYSVPTQYAFRDAIVEVYEDRLHIIVENERIAQHPRGFGSNERYLDLVHYVDLLQHKHRSAATALVLADGRVPAVLHELFARYRHQNDATATRRWTKVLALLVDTSVDQLAQTVTHALAMGADDPSAIELLLRQRSLPRSPADLHKHKLPTSAQLDLVRIDLSLYVVRNPRAYGEHRMTSEPMLELHLRGLHLFAVLANYKHALADHSEPLSYLSHLIALESSKRHENGVRARVAAARFPTIKTIESFDFALQPELPMTKLLEHFDGQFIAAHRNLILSGPPDPATLCTS